jgi:hypothetical protein
MKTPIAQTAKSFFAAALLAGSVSLSGCIEVSTSFDGETLAEFDQGGDAPTGIGLVGPDDLFLVVGDSLDMEVSGDDSAVDALRFKREGDSLTIGRDGDWSNSMGTARITITMPAPEEINLVGSGDINAETIADRAAISMAGAGTVKVATIASSALEVSSAGSGKVQGTGSVKKLDISIMGSGDIDFSKLKADKVDISIAGSGNVELMSDGEVETSIAGSGNVNVVGDAKCTADAMGSGQLTCNPA